MRWIGSVAVAACLVAAGAIRPVHTERTEPHASELAAAKALAGKVVPRRGAEATPELRRSPGSVLAFAPAPPAVAPPRTTLLDAERPASGVLRAPPGSSRSARGPPG